MYLAVLGPRGGVPCGGAWDFFFSFFQGVQFVPVQSFCLCDVRALRLAGMETREC